MNQTIRLLLTTLLLLQSCASGFHTSSVKRKRAFVLGSTQTRSRSAKIRDSSIVKDKGVERLSSESNVVELPPVLKSIVDERREYQMKVGKAMDTIRSDMPNILWSRPDFSIFDEHMTVIDPSGVQLRGLDAYKSAFAFLQGFCNFWFHSRGRSGIQFRMMYDFCRSSIRVSWNAKLVPKVPLGGPLYVDGVSYYQLDVVTGTVIEHRVEKLIINDRSVMPPYGIFSLLQQDALRGIGRPQGIPVGIGAMIQTNCS